jgi:hypothetical protein
MARFTETMRGVIDLVCGVCGLLVLAIPLWFALAAFGTKWEFWGWHTGLEAMTHVWGFRLLLAGLVIGVVAAGLITAHALLARRRHGSWISALAVMLVAVAGIGWTIHLDRLQSAMPAILDISTDFIDPPHFSAAFASRHSSADASLVYADKTAADGQALPELQTRYYPQITSLHLDEPVELAFDRALEIARDDGWRIGTAARQAGMFEAGAESFWFGFRDDMVVRIRPDAAGGSVVDVRSLARQPAHDMGRNARRVAVFLEALAAG